MLIHAYFLRTVRSPSWLPDHNPHFTRKAPSWEHSENECAPSHVRFPRAHKKRRDAHIVGTLYAEVFARRLNLKRLNSSPKKSFSEQIRGNVNIHCHYTLQLAFRHFLTLLCADIIAFLCAVVNLVQVYTNVYTQTVVLLHIFKSEQQFE